MKKRFKFTTTKLNALPANHPDSRSTECEYSDTEITGLKLLVGKNGKKKFLVRFSLNGKKGSLALGAFPAVELVVARRSASRIRQLVVEGVDPRIVPENTEILTVKEFFDIHYLPTAKTRKKTWKHDIARFRHCESIYDIPYDQLKASHIQNIQIGMTERVHRQGRMYSKATINRTMCLLKGMGRLAEQLFDTPNVASKISLYAENNARTRYCSIQETQRIITECRNYHCKIRGNFIALLFLMGCRDSELRTRKRADLNLVKRTLTVPETKNGTAHTIYLTDLMVELFREIPQSTKSPYIFPGTKPNTYIGQPRWAYDLIKRRANIPDPKAVVLHCARHSYASNLASSGVDVGVLKQLLNHKSITSTIRYAKISEDKQRETATRLSDMINRA